MCGSAGWAIALALENAAKVRTLGQVELLFTFAVSRWWFHDRHTRAEYVASALVAVGRGAGDGARLMRTRRRVRRQARAFFGAAFLAAAFFAGAAFFAAARFVAAAFLAGAPPFSMMASRRTASSS